MACLTWTLLYQRLTLALEENIARRGTDIERSLLPAIGAEGGSQTVLRKKCTATEQSPALQEPGRVLAGYR